MEAKHQMLRIEGDVHHRKQLNQAAAAVAASAPSSPPHEFSFTISLHSPAARIPGYDKYKSSPPSFAAAVDLSPADEIFFHGHLLPLHLLSHLPVSPRSSTNSLDSFTLPIKELLHNQNNIIDDGGADHGHDRDGRRHGELEAKGREKPKSFSIFAMPKWRKGGGGGDGDVDDQQTRKRKSRFEILKRYVRFVKPFFSLRSRRRENPNEHLRPPPPHSYPGNLRFPKKRDLMRGRRGEYYSAPTSMRTSPVNSGLLVMGSGASTPTAKSDSTMEELQAAIQAAIAHCKKSVAAEDKIKLPP